MSEKVVNTVADWLRREIELTERSRQLGIYRALDETTVRNAFIRAAEEIEQLSHQRTVLAKAAESNVAIAGRIDFNSSAVERDNSVKEPGADAGD